jgi:hypothetical protein
MIAIKIICKTINRPAIDQTGSLNRFIDPLGASIYRCNKIARNFLLLSKRNHAILPVGNLKVDRSMKEKPDVLQGTLALMVHVRGIRGIRRCIEQISRDLA